MKTSGRPALRVADTVPYPPCVTTASQYGKRACWSIQRSMRTWAGCGAEAGRVVVGPDRHDEVDALGRESVDDRAEQVRPVVDRPERGVHRRSRRQRRRATAVPASASVAEWLDRPEAVTRRCRLGVGFVRGRRERTTAGGTGTASRHRDRRAARTGCADPVSDSATWCAIAVRRAPGIGPDHRVRQAEDLGGEATAVLGRLAHDEVGAPAAGEVDEVGRRAHEPWRRRRRALARPRVARRAGWDRRHLREGAHHLDGQPVPARPRRRETLPRRSADRTTPEEANATS